VEEAWREYTEGATERKIKSLNGAPLPFGAIVGIFNI